MLILLRSNDPIPPLIIILIVMVIVMAILIFIYVIMYIFYFQSYPELSKIPLQILEVFMCSSTLLKNHLCLILLLMTKFGGQSGNDKTFMFGINFQKS